MQCKIITKKFLVKERVIKSIEISELIELYSWHDVPKKIMSREGHDIDTASDIWHLPYAIRDYSSIDFGKIENKGVSWASKRYIQDKLEFTSTHAGFASFQDVWRELLRNQTEFGVVSGIDSNDLEKNLISLIESALSETRKAHRLCVMYRPIQWYIWCAENYPEIGFCPEFAMELDSLSIPGNPKGEAVRLEDVDRGPLNRTLELPLLIKAMRQDKKSKFEFLQEKAALALSIALGRNPANLTYLKEKDLTNLTPNSEVPTWVINMPRIKKRLLNPRDDMLQEYLDPEFATYIIELIGANKNISTVVEINNTKYTIDRPLFINPKGNKAAKRSKLYDSYFNVTSEAISKMLQQFVKRHRIISPLSNELVRINTRRLRYTLGTALAAEGISKKELARILDHTDTQSVLVYFELAGSVVEHLDKAAAKGFSKYLNLFKGSIIKNDSEALNGERDDKHLTFFGETNPTEQAEIGVCGKKTICHLDPPYSCYLCEKFQPYEHANHDLVLDWLLESREERIRKYDNYRLGIQLDDVIIAVAEVAEICKVRMNNA